MRIKREKLEELVKKLLKDTQDHSALTVRIVKRKIEDELGLETNDLDSQTEEVKQILMSVLEGPEIEQDTNIETPTPNSTTQAPKTTTSTKRKAVKETEEEEEEEEKEDKPKPKRVKNPVTTKPAKKATSDNPLGQENEDGDLYFELHDLKRVTIKQWKNENHVDLRNFWRKDGDICPTGKGVMLTRAQWKKLTESVAEIDKMIEKK